MTDFFRNSVTSSTGTREKDSQFFRYCEGMADVDVAPPTTDLLALGRRLRHYRRARGLTLDELGAAVGRAPSHLSLIENGRREPKLSLLRALAGALEVPLNDLLAAEPPSRRAALEITLERAQQGPLYQSLGLPYVHAGRRLPIEALEALVGLHEELVRRASEHAATPEEARRANAELRAQMRERGNYFPEIEAAAQSVLEAVGHHGGPLSQHVMVQMAEHLGFELHYVPDLPLSTRSIADLRNRRIYLPQVQRPGTHDARLRVLQMLGHVVLGHAEPKDYPDFLRQRVEVNYFAAALRIPEPAAVELLQTAKKERQLAIEDLRDAFAVSHETAAHRFTNLATHHLGIPVHFMRVHESGVIYKAYENDGVSFPTDVLGAIEGQPVCRKWTAYVVFDLPDRSAAYSQYTDTPRGTYWCTAQAEATNEGVFSISLGVPYAHVKWFRGRDTTARGKSLCPDPDCCRRPPATLAAKWSGQAWPSARAHSHLLAALPPGTFPGVDDTEVFTFLERHAPAETAAS
jgi:predicted transcriptional regulator/DNA-binding XRE family transcriptional regulator